MSLTINDDMAASREAEIDRPCNRCAFWGDGISDPDDLARWRTCRGDQKKFFAHRDHGCGLHQPAVTLRKALRRAENSASQPQLEATVF